ncbi:hypothetical protein TNCV_3302651 [Trichonephila clavipes]|nr:hypothetical protein TNCV_3302651 [Trichonephila clavipes]
MPQKLILDGTFSEPPQRSTPSCYASFQQMSGANCVQWAYAVVYSLISCNLSDCKHHSWRVLGSSLNSIKCRCIGTLEGLLHLTRLKNSKKLAEKNSWRLSR